jgi:outer membrane lipoprotein SlyB
MIRSILNQAKFLGIVSVLALGACSSGAPLGSNTGRVVDSRSSRLCVECGTVRSITPVGSEGRRSSGVGAVIGAILGGVAGRQVGGGTGRDVATVAGAVGGAVAGNAVERARNDNQVYDVRIRMEDGSERIVTVADARDLDVGTPVTVEGSDIMIR